MITKIISPNNDFINKTFEHFLHFAPFFLKIPKIQNHPKGNSLSLQHRGYPQNRTQSNVKNIHFGPILSPKKNSKPITD